MSWFGRNKKSEKPPVNIISSSKERKAVTPSDNDLKRDFDKVSKELQEMKLENSRLREEIGKKDIDSVNLYNDFQRELMNWKQKYSELKKNYDLEKSKDKNPFIHQSSQTIKIVALESENERLHNSIERSEIKIKELLEENSSYKSQLSSLQSKSQYPYSSNLNSQSITTLTKNLEQYQLKIKELEGENQNIERENKKLENENLKLKVKNQELEKTIENQSIIFSKKITEHENELNSKFVPKQENERLKNDLEMRDYDNLKLKEQIASLEFVYSETSEQNCELNKKIKNFEKIIENLEDSLDERREDKRVLDETLNNNSKITQNLIETKDKLNEFKLISQEKDKELASAKNEIANLQKKLRSNVQDEIQKIKVMVLEANRHSKDCSSKMAQIDQFKFDEKYNFIKETYDSLQTEIHELLLKKQAN